MNQNAPCKLCGNKSKLLRKSHIVPNFMYKPLIDESRRMLLASLIDPQAPPTFYQSGFYDKYILCEKCDTGLLSKLEKYAAPILYGGNLRNAPLFQHTVSSDGCPIVLVSNIDYVKFKLFILSFLWRAHISTNPFFKHIDIGRHESIIRRMILDGQPGPREQYPIFITALHNKSRKAVMMFPEPNVYQNIDGEEYAIFIISGYAYMIGLSDNPQLPVFTYPYLKEDNVLEVPIISGDAAHGFLKSTGLRDDIIINFLYLTRDENV